MRNKFIKLLKLCLVLFGCFGLFGCASTGNPVFNEIDGSLQTIKGWVSNVSSRFDRPGPDPGPDILEFVVTTEERRKVSIRAEKDKIDGMVHDNDVVSVYGGFDSSQNTFIAKRITNTLTYQVIDLEEKEEPMKPGEFIFLGLIIWAISAMVP